jgi:hypothetical protein
MIRAAVALPDDLVEQRGEVRGPGVHRPVPGVEVDDAPARRVREGRRVAVHGRVGLEAVDVRRADLGQRARQDGRVEQRAARMVTRMGEQQRDLSLGQVLAREVPGIRLGPQAAVALDPPPHESDAALRPAVDHRESRPRQVRVEEDRVRHPLGGAGDDLAGHDARVAVADQRHLRQFVRREVVEHVGDVVGQPDLGRGAVGALAEAGQGQRVHLVSGRLEPHRHGIPRGRPEPRARDQNYGRHARSS